MFEWRLLRKLDWLLLAAALALCGVGMLAIYSASRPGLLLQGQPPAYLLSRQLLWFGLGLVLLGGLLYLDYMVLLRWRRAIYLVAVVLLLLVIKLGHSSGGAMRWLGVGPLSLQPSELSKLAVLIGLAALLRRDPAAPLSGGALLRSGLYVAVPFLLVFKQPDLGTALVLAALWATMVFLAGAHRWHLLALALAGVLAFSAAWQMGMLKDYQKDRLRVFVDPGADPLGAGYHVTQSRIAIGSGRLVGKGYLRGTQSQLRFIPEQHTDFVFAVIGEEWGLLGGLGVIALYLLLIWRMGRLAEAADDAFGALLAAGGAAMLVMQCVVNMGMTMGIMPVTGIPLPFLSYGGSSLLTNLGAVALALNVGMRRQKIRW